MGFDIFIFVVSFAAAFLFALGGVGAAIILIPILVSLGIPINIAKPVGLFYNTISLTGASVSNIKNGILDFKLGIPVIIFSFLFAVPGAYLSKFIPTNIILIVFILFLLFSSVMFMFYKRPESAVYRTDIPFGRLALIGSFAGLLSGLLGIGGGGVISPLMMMLGFNPKKIAAVTAFVVPFSSLSGFITYWAMASVDWHILIVVSIAGVLGASLGTIFMQKKLNPQHVKKILALILLLMAVKLIFSHLV